ncbi:MAG: twin-arginine translocase TatA/TatE family subunit [Rhodospirillales bacterium]|jgi:sec-independent protein translocase protein TatA|nr:twin-arginine translocase TatA/TatE family subunit [Rhodospirillales bacterium]HIJ43047.1 twin-arginine translocase TatA/TatE family subunit [Rhodospirillaceae bacterium]MDP7216238.1 twin-arginine translocase TatA/TatE family subunit [Rhodospirillales bacterium]HIJ44617.1 twin-arginine translocase TatA/TatE family subunit [Rhodospirillaceae bacterium]HIJ92155.1 twin-arginine translocase TatA/TatE family subunit [Rhodospirillaceae bacterium]|tara:strand:- start:94 stop:336 length:243 start_codon:yes stop_codon:yes gene_type:complete
MGGWTGIWQWVVVLAIVLLLFGGRGKISALMGDFGKGLKSFKKSMDSDEELAADGEPKVLKSEQAEIAETAPKKDHAAKG